jgi:hypothetical protein
MSFSGFRNLFWGIAFKNKIAWLISLASASPTFNRMAEAGDGGASAVVPPRTASSKTDVYTEAEKVSTPEGKSADGPQIAAVSLAEADIHAGGTEHPMMYAPSNIMRARQNRAANDRQPLGQDLSESPWLAKNGSHNGDKTCHLCAQGDRSHGCPPPPSSSKPPLHEGVIDCVRGHKSKDQLGHYASLDFDNKLKTNIRSSPESHKRDPCFEASLLRHNPCSDTQANCLVS